MKKVLLSTTLAATLAVTSIAAFAAVPGAGNKAASVNNTAVSSAVKNNSKGNIEYTKKTLFNPDGSISAVTETWADPSTGNKRLDYLEPAKGTSTLNKVESCFVLDNGTRYIKATEDGSGSLSGISMKMKNAGKFLTADKQDYINEFKAGTRSAGWSDEGTVKTADGKELTKLSKADKSTMPGEEGKTYIENVYLDKSSGLPVNGDISVEKAGKTSLLYTYVYDYANVSNNGSLFSTQGISLTNNK